MAFVCDITGRKPLVGYRVSHAHNKTKMTQKPNLRTIHMVMPDGNKMTMRVCADALKDLKRRGIILRWKDRPENKKEKAVATPAKPVSQKPKKATPKAKKAAVAKKKVAK